MEKKLIIPLLLIIFSMGSCDTVISNKDKLESIVRLCEQYGYYEGQKDALHGKIQIDTATNRWIKFPMIIGVDTEQRQYYNPMLSEHENIEIQIKGN